MKHKRSSQFTQIHTNGMTIKIIKLYINIHTITKKKYQTCYNTK